MTSPPWVVNARYDQWFMFLGWLVPFALWGLASHSPDGLLAAGLLFLIVDRAHLWATAPLTFLDRQTMRESWGFYVLGLLALSVTAIQCTIMGGWADAFWGSIVLYWGAFHIIRQHYGFLRLYQARSGLRAPRLIGAELGCLYCGTLFPYLLNLQMGWAERGQEGQAFRLVILAPPPIVVWIVLAAFLYFTARLLGEVRQRIQRGLEVGWLPLTFLALAVSNFWVAALGPGRTSLLVGIIFITSFHNLQYLGLVWYVGRRRQASLEPASWNRALFAHPVVFIAFVTAGSLLYVFLQGLLPMARSLFVEHPAEMHLVYNLILATAYAHYLFDGRLWQMRANPRLRAELGLGQDEGRIQPGAEGVVESDPYPA